MGFFKNASEFIQDPHVPQAINEGFDSFRLRIERFVGSGNDFSLNPLSSADAKLDGLYMTGLLLEKNRNAAADCEKKMELLAAAMLSQMSHGSVGSFGRRFYKYTYDSFNRKNAFIMRHISAASLKRWLEDDPQSVIRTGDSCQDKIEYVMRLFEFTTDAKKEAFVRDGMSEKQKILLEVGMRQFEYMANVEKKADTPEYAALMRRFLRAVGMDGH